MLADTNSQSPTPGQSPIDNHVQREISFLPQSHLGLQTTVKGRPVPWRETDNTKGTHCYFWSVVFFFFFFTYRSFAKIFWFLSLCLVSLWDFYVFFPAFVCISCVFFFASFFSPIYLFCLILLFYFILLLFFLVACLFSNETK